MEKIPRISRSPLYMQVRQILLSQIQSGDWRPGQQIPTEPVLASQFDVSIGTIRKAIDSLVNDGLILKKEGIGTFVKAYKGGGYWNAFHIFRDLEGRVRGTKSNLLLFENTTAPEFITRSLMVDKDCEFIHIIRHWFHTYNNAEELVSIDESFLIAKEFKGLTYQRFLDSFDKKDSFYQFFDREFGVVIVNQRCTTCYEKVSAEIASIIQVPSGFETLRTDRISYTFGHKPVEYRINRGQVNYTKIYFDLSNA